MHDNLTCYAAALKFFRTLANLQDTFYFAQLTHNNVFGLILDIVYESMPRDNLLNSACLEFFEFIKRETIKPLITHIVEAYRKKLEEITYVDTFQTLITRYDQMQGYGDEPDITLYSQEEEAVVQRPLLNGQRWQGVREMDAAEEEYFNGSDEEEEVSKMPVPETHDTPAVHVLILCSGNKRITPKGLLRKDLQQLNRWSTIPMTKRTRTLWTQESTGRLGNSLYQPKVTWNSALTPRRQRLLSPQHHRPP